MPPNTEPNWKTFGCTQILSMFLILKSLNILSFDTTGLPYPQIFYAFIFHHILIINSLIHMKMICLYCYHKPAFRDVSGSLRGWDFRGNTPLLRTGVFIWHQCDQINSSYLFPRKMLLHFQSFGRFWKWNVLVSEELLTNTRGEKNAGRDTTGQAPLVFTFRSSVSRSTPRTLKISLIPDSRPTPCALIQGQHGVGSTGGKGMPQQQASPDCCGSSAGFRVLPTFFPGLSALPSPCRLGILEEENESWEDFEKVIIYVLTPLPLSKRSWN